MRPSFAGGLVSALGWVLAFPPVSLWGATLLAVAPLAWAADGAAKAGRPIARCALAAGVGTLPAWAWLTRWSAEGTAAGFPILVLYLGVFVVIAVWATARIRRQWAGVPLWAATAMVWVAVELLRGRVVFDGFPWLLVSHPLIDARPFGGASLAWPAAFVGTYAVSGLLALTSAWLVDLPGRHRRVAAWLPGLAPAAWGVGAALAPAGASGSAEPPLRAALIQTDLPQSIRGGWTFADRVESWRDWRVMLADAAAGRDKPPPNLIVFPETMFPGRVLQEDAAAVERESRLVWILDGPGGDTRIPAGALRDDLLQLQSGSGVPVLIGAPRFVGFEIVETEEGFLYDYERYYNSVFLIEGGVVAEPAYDKQHLTPFGEVMPYISAWPWLESRLLDIAARGMRFDVSAGDNRRVFSVARDAGGPTGVVAPICFEATMPGICRRLVFEGGLIGGPTRRAGVMVNVTNDGWFYDASGGRELHQLAARWRCVELATPMVRAANTGISSAIDASGRVVRALPPFEPGVLVAEVTPGAGVTVFARVGDAAAWICLFGAIPTLALTYTGTGRSPRSRFRTDRPGQDDKPQGRDDGGSARQAD